MGSGTNGPSRTDTSFSSLEVALDQAIARRFAGVEERVIRKRRSEPDPVPTTVLPSPSTALAVTSKATDLAIVPLPRLQWRGIAVSPEFQEYASRVARGEELAPYRGEVLSRHCATFPWDATDAMSTTAPTPTLPKYPERRSSLKTAVSLVASVGSILAAFGLGSGAAPPDTDVDLPAFQPSRAVSALHPTPAARGAAAQPETRQPDQAIGTALPASPLALQAESASLAAPAPAARRQPAIATNVRRPLDARAPASAPTRGAAAPALAVTDSPSSIPASGSPMRTSATLGSTLGSPSTAPTRSIFGSPPAAKSSAPAFASAAASGSAAYASPAFGSPAFGSPALGSPAFGSPALGSPPFGGTPVGASRPTLPTSMPGSSATAVPAASTALATGALKATPPPREPLPRDTILFSDQPSF